MNPLAREAAEAVRLGWLLAVMTVVFFVAFVAWIWWAWSPRNRRYMEEARHLPFSEGGDA